MPQFAPDQVSFNDVAAYGYWDVAHHREHLQFVQTLATRRPAVLMATYDLLVFLTAGGDRRAVIESHNTAHNLLRQAAGVQGFDLAGFDLNNESDFYSFTGYHAQEHAAIRAALGIT